MEEKRSRMVEKGANGIGRKAIRNRGRRIGNRKKLGIKTTDIQVESGLKRTMVRI